MGIDDDTLAALARYPDSDLFTPLERAALELAVAMTTTPAEIADDLRARLLAGLTPGQLTELVAAIAWENHRARLNRALDVHAMGFTDGAYCVLPSR